MPNPNPKLAALQTVVIQRQLDGIVLTDAALVQSYCGFVASSAWLIIRREEVLLLTDARYLAKAKTLECATAVNFSELSKAWFAEQKIKRLGAVHDKVTLGGQVQWDKWGVKIVDATMPVMQLGSHKTSSEVAACARACAVADAALTAALTELHDGVTEWELAWAIEKYGREHGASAVSFEPIVAFGEHTAVPHHSPTDRALTTETAILIDWGFIVDGVCSDCTRCFWWGEQPDAEWVALYESVAAAQSAGIAAIRAGAPIAATQAAAELSFGEKMVHSFGHGVGNVVHEYPALTGKASDDFAVGQLVTAEPGLYRDGQWGVRIEDLGVVMADGYEILTKFSKNFQLKL